MTVALAEHNAENHGGSLPGKKAPPASNALDQLQQRLKELQHQRAMLKRPEELRDRPDHIRGPKARPRTAAALPVPMRASRPSDRRTSVGSSTATVEGLRGAALTDQHHHGYQAPLRPTSAAHAPSARGFMATLPFKGQSPSTARQLRGGSFGAACGSAVPPLFSVSSTPRIDSRDSSTSSSSEADQRVHTLRKLIREGYARLGLPTPTITQSTQLQPLLYRQEKVIGKGAFGLVSLARSVVTGELVAMKTIDRAKLHSENLKKTVEHEIRILKRLRHRRIVRLYEVIETPRSIHIVMEYVDGGTVQQLVKKNKRISEPDAQRIMVQLVDAVSHCHGHHVCHRDLKLENFMLSRNARSLKLIDFGLSVVWKQGQGLFKSYGTPCYMAPEIIKGNNYMGPDVDVWSLGVALATMLTGSLPFQGSGDTELKKRILRGQFPCPEHVSTEARDLLAGMLALNPTERLDIDAVRRHPWLANVSGKEDGDPDRPEAPGTHLPLDDAIMGQLEKYGFDASEVERSVRTNAYNHECACYDMLLSAAQAERSSRDADGL